MKRKTVIYELEKYTPIYEDNVIKLDANEMAFDQPNIYKNMFLNRYPDNEARILKASIATYLSVSENSISLGNGSSEMIELLLKTYLNPNDLVMGFEPSFSLYEVFTKIYNGRYLAISCEDGYTCDVDLLIKAAKLQKPKLIFLCNPNNPTGYKFSKSDLERVLKNVDCMVVIDEAYIEFAEGSMLNRLECYSNLIVLRTFSKAWGLAGIRLGYLIARETVVQSIETIRSPYNINKMTQEIATLAMSNSNILETSIKKSNELREILYQALLKENVKVYKSFANFLYFKEDLALYSRLRENGILIRSFNNTYYRVTIGSEKENEAFLKTYKEVRRQDD